MRQAPTGIQNLEQASPVVWTSTGDNPAFIIDITAGQTGFIGFFLMAGRGALAPKLSFDQGEGFDTAPVLSLRTFPVAFYHVSLDRMRGVRRVRFRPCAGRATFRFLAVRTRSAVVIGILHYLFNLRYQKISITIPNGPRRIGFAAWLAGNAARIARFFDSVSTGAGILDQQSNQEALPDLISSLSRMAEPVEQTMRAILARRSARPLISFVAPTYDTSAAHLAGLLRSFGVQKADYAELVLSDDGSTRRGTLARLENARTLPGVRVVRNADNRGIAAATNAGITASKGEWIAFIDHDDQFAPGAIAVIARAIHDNPDADFFYTDEIVADALMRPVVSFCKPAFDSVLLSGVNYVNHFSIFRRARLDEIGCLGTDREGSQDYDLLLRYLAAAKPGSAIHIPFLAYLWRRGEQSYSSAHAARATANARRALQAAYESPALPVTIGPALDASLHRVRFSRKAATPCVSVVIPNRNQFGLISRILGDLRRRTDYPRIEIIVVDNGTTDAPVLRFYEQIARASPSVVVDIIPEAFNFAGMCNRGARLAGGALLLFLNNDIEVQDSEWLSEMVECLAFPATGIVGAKLLYPNGAVQHNGVIVGLGDAAGHWHAGEAGDEPGPMGRFNVRQTFSAVTGACMLVTRACFEAVGGFDHDAFPIAYNDIDFCLRARRAGFRTVWTPFAELIHHESASRGSDEFGDNNRRFQQEAARLRERHGTAGYIDDAYSPFYDRRHSKPRLVLPDGLPSVRPNVFS